MKRSISILILFFYLVFTFRFLIPYLEYTINFSYISKVLCINKDDVSSTCNGQCHLSKQLKKVEGSQEPKEGLPINNRVTSESITYVHTKETSLIIFSYSNNIEYPLFRVGSIYSVFLEISTPPPQPIV